MPLARLQKFREQAESAESIIVDAEGAREELDSAQDFVSGAWAFVEHSNE